MRNIVMMIVMITALNAESYEDRFYKNINYHPSNISIHSDIAYSSYILDLSSSELNSAINYDIVEFILGVSYSYDSWMWGISGKFILDELKSNMNIVPSGERLDDHANINKDEFILYGNYTLSQNEKNRWSINGIYRYAKLDAKDSYLSYYNYKSLFYYRTQGVAISLVYNRYLTENSSFFINTGVIHSYAKVEVSESIEDRLQDSYIETSSSALGMKLSFGYNYKILSNTFVNIRIDGWKSNFEKLKVKSRVGDKLPSATLKEQLFTLSVGLTEYF